MGSTTRKKHLRGISLPVLENSLTNMKEAGVTENHMIRLLRNYADKSLVKKVLRNDLNA
jgi:hypothetical protein